MDMMFSVREFCQAHRISRALFYRLAKEGKAPKTAKVGRRTLISQEAAAEWRHQIEDEATTAGPRAPSAGILQRQAVGGRRNAA